MIDLKRVSEIKNVLNNKTIEKIEDTLGNIIYEAWKKLIKQGIPPLTLTNCKENKLLNYQIYGNSKQGRLPDGYTELEYIQSTGTQYIDTGVKVSTNNRVELDLQFTDISTGQINGGYYMYQVGSTSYTARNDIGVSGITNYFFLGASAESITTNVTKDTNRHKFMVDARTGEWSIDDVSGSVTPVSHEDSTVNVFIGARQGSTSISSYCYEKIYNVKIYNFGNLVRNMIPCKNSSNVIGMYDLVNDTFYTNQGTGDFTAGPVIYADYIDYENQKVYRNVTESFDSKTTTEESIELPDILLNAGTNVVDVETSITPSNIELTYKGKEV